MSVWGAFAGGFVGTLVLTTAMRAANELKLTRIDLPFLLGTALTADRARAKAIGYGLHFFFGQVFALSYYAVFVAIGHSGWGHGPQVGASPRRSSSRSDATLPRPLSGAGDVSLLEPPGFLLRNYGVQTPLVTIAAHIAYGAIVGGFISLAG